MLYLGIDPYRKQFTVAILDELGNVRERRDACSLAERVWLNRDCLASGPKRETA